MSVALEVVPTLNMAPMGLEPSAIASMVPKDAADGLNWSVTKEQYKSKVHDLEGAKNFVRRQLQITLEKSQLSGFLQANAMIVGGGLLRPDHRLIGSWGHVRQRYDKSNQGTVR